MNSKYFVPKPETLEELKTMYRKLAIENHPDKGGNAETMKEINNEYDVLFPLLKDVHRNFEGEVYTAHQESTESADSFKDLISELMKTEGIIIEIIGRFIWVTGNTKPYREQLKALNFQWHSKKLAWYLKPEDYRMRSHKDYSLDEIRFMYGTSDKMNSNGITKLEQA